MYKNVLMIIAALFAVITIFLLLMTVFFFFRENPQLIGKNNLPIDIFSSYYSFLYTQVFLFLLILVSAGGVLFLKKWGWYFFQFVILLNLVIVLNDWLTNYQKTEDLILILAKGVSYLIIIAIHYEIKIQKAFLINRKYNLVEFICMSVLSLIINSLMN